MHTELPVCARCCFWFPLRYGLLVWGYLKLIITCLLLTGFFMTLVRLVRIYTNNGPSLVFREIIIISIVAAVFIIDGILNSLFIIGSHKKNIKLLKVFYNYCIVIWVLLAVIGTLLIIKIVIRFGMLSSYRLFIEIGDMAGLFVQIVVHTYFLLLLRSEIMKLSNNCEFRFVNNAAQSECQMKCATDADVEKAEEETPCDNETPKDVDEV